MDAEALLLVASTAGAGLFFGAGWLGARFRAGPAQPARAPRAPSVTGDPAAEAHRRRVLEAEKADLARRVGELEEREAELGRSLAVAESRAQRASELERDAEARHERQRAALAAELSELRQRAVSAERPRVEQGSDAALLAAQLERERQESAAIREEKTRLLLDLEELGARNAELEERAQAALELEGLRLELVAARAKLDEHAKLKDENTRLRAELRELAQTESELSGLRRENTELRAVAFAQAKVPSRRPGAPPAGTVELAMAPVLGHDNVRAAVLADDLGFPVAGSGGEVDALAAFTGLILGVSHKVQGLLPVGTIRSMSFAAEHGVTINVCPVQAGGVEMALTTLAVGPGPSLETLGRAAQQAGQVFDRREKEEVLR